MSFAIAILLGIWLWSICVRQKADKINQYERLKWEQSLPGWVKAWSKEAYEERVGQYNVATFLLWVVAAAFVGAYVAIFSGDVSRLDDKDISDLIFYLVIIFVVVLGFTIRLRPHFIPATDCDDYDRDAYLNSVFHCGKLDFFEIDGYLYEADDLKRLLYYMAIKREGWLPKDEYVKGIYNYDLDAIGVIVGGDYDGLHGSWFTDISGFVNGKYTSCKDFETTIKFSYGYDKKQRRFKASEDGGFSVPRNTDKTWWESDEKNYKALYEYLGAKWIRFDGYNGNVLKETTTADDVYSEICVPAGELRWTKDGHLAQGNFDIDDMKFVSPEMITAVRYDKQEAYRVEYSFKKRHDHRYNAPKAEIKTYWFDGRKKTIYPLVEGRVPNGKGLLLSKMRFETRDENGDFVPYDVIGKLRDRKLGPPGKTNYQYWERYACGKYSREPYVWNKAYAELQDRLRGHYYG